MAGEKTYQALLKTATASNNLNYTLLRDLLLPQLLGAENASILYWAGKDLARQLPLANLEALPDFFQQFNFGDLSLQGEGKHQYRFLLAGTAVTQRQAAFETPEFQLETGFLAQQIQQITGAIAEGEASINRQGVVITVQIDHSTESHQNPEAIQLMGTTSGQQVDQQPTSEATGTALSRQKDHRKKRWFGH
ncbi:DUF2507 domain-containing protein [Loigolactobacillus bifermentans]|jgi:hypothetical protein|uniref:DUF2507 domain-containing protein n=1 Tax=Loigolactobacillus bifermentans DSM 20003 TaxID=1423726 RepID=A0A0R1H1W3_9LACO|nr:DUF2507 domain-containing protein [Loigolactobacillus bifermentans]KRK40248.1 hypothetical protein FC07_GL001109 [Loigolactobacillus bifermentans DSM 20003]QGG61721.1 DUF2507 domain-containing protein [Loigolactobacillus bifermentans]